MNDSRHLLFAYEKIAERYKKKGEVKKSDEFSKRAFDIRKNDYSITQKNYLELYILTNKRGIKLIIMQYPTLDINELKKIFKGDEGIIFVSNEDNFKKPIDNSSYDEYFIDNFGKTFGHATKKGQQLIAENVANEVLKVVEK